MLMICVCEPRPGRGIHRHHRLPSSLTLLLTLLLTLDLDSIVPLLSCQKVSSS